MFKEFIHSISVFVPTGYWTQKGLLTLRCNP